MSLPIQEKIDQVVQCLKDGGISYLDISGSFKVDLDTGHSVYVYSDVRANSFTARFETTETDADKRRADLEALRDELNRVITVAEVAPFQDSDHYGKRFVYTADLDFDAAARPDGTAAGSVDAAASGQPASRLTLDQKIRRIVASLESHAIRFQDISGSLNVNINAGLSVYVYSDTSTDCVVARYESTQDDPDMRATDVETISVALNFMLDKAVVSEFSEDEPCGKRFVYIAAIYFEGEAEYDALQETTSFDIDDLPDDTDEPKEDLTESLQPGLSSSRDPARPPRVPLETTLENKHNIITESLQARGIPFLDVSSSFKVEFGPDLSVYIYTEIYDNSIHVRYETRQTDETVRLANLDVLKEKLKQAIPGIDLDPFEKADPCGKKFVYTARMEFYTPAGQPPADSGDRLPEADPALAAMKDLPAVGEAIELLEGMDSRMLREGLDSMYLKRSSHVRAAINRIFRGMSDESELIPLIYTEAKKIVRQEEIEELQMVKTTHGEGMFKPLIELLCYVVFNGSSS